MLSLVGEVAFSNDDVGDCEDVFKTMMATTMPTMLQFTVVNHDKGKYHGDDL